MSDSVILGGDIVLSARAATMHTLFAYLRRREPDHPEFQPLVLREQEFDAIGGWFFDMLSLNALLRLQELVEELATDPTAANHWNEERRPLFWSNLATFRQKLAERITQL